MKYKYERMDTMPAMGKQILSTLIFALSVSFSVLAAGPAANAAELVMFFSEDCEYSAIFDIEAAPSYRKSAIGEVVPLKRVAIGGDHPGGYRLKEPLTVTPTFVLVENGEELGRFAGYPGRRNFGRLVTHLVERHRE